MIRIFISDSFHIHILMFANEIRPYQCHADHRRKTCEMRISKRIKGIKLRPFYLKKTEVVIASPMALKRKPIIGLINT